MILSALSNQTVIVTGASSGIGQSACLYLLEKGYRVVPCVRKQSDLAFWQTKSGATPLRLDVADEESMELAIAQIKDILSSSFKVHLINNAGIAVSGPVEHVNMKKWREQFDVNFFGALKMCQLLLPAIRRTQGRIINISSISGLLAFPFMGPYCASKFALEAMSDSLRRELRPVGVKVVLIEPGPIATPIWEKNLQQETQVKKELGPVAMEIYGERLQKFVDSVKGPDSKMMTVADVNHQIDKALRLENPKNRYLVVKGSNAFSVALAKYLPTEWVDYLLGKVLR